MKTLLSAIILMTAMATQSQAADLCTAKSPVWKYDSITRVGQQVLIIAPRFTDGRSEYAIADQGVPTGTAACLALGFGQGVATIFSGDQVSTISLNSNGTIESIGSSSYYRVYSLTCSLTKPATGLGFTEGK